MPPSRSQSGRLHRKGRRTGSRDATSPAIVGLGASTGSMVLIMPFCMNTKSRLRSGTVRSYTSWIESAPAEDQVCSSLRATDTFAQMHGGRSQTCAHKDRRIGWAFQSDSTTAWRLMEDVLHTKRISAYCPFCARSSNSNFYLLEGSKSQDCRPDAA